jgi:hypothetical protein
VLVTVVAVASDATLITPELFFDRSTDCIRGLLQQPELRWPDLATPELRNEVTEKIRRSELTFIKAGTIITATLLGNSPHTQPISVQFSGEADTVDRILENLRATVKQLTTCQLCLEDGEICTGFYCAQCHRDERVCDSCKVHGFAHWYHGFRQCFHCLKSPAKCVRLMPAMVSMDSGGAQLSAQMSLSTGFGNTDSDPSEREMDDLSIALSTVLPFGEGPHNIKSWLCALRKPTLISFNGIWFVCLSIVAEMAHCGSIELSEKIRRLLPPERLMLRDRQDPKNATYWTNPELLSLIPQDLLCATLLPTQAFNDHEQPLKSPTHVAVSGSDIIIADKEYIYWAHPAVKTELRKLQPTPPGLTSICLAPIRSKRGKPNILLFAANKELRAIKVTSKKQTPLDIPPTPHVLKVIPSECWRGGTVLAICERFEQLGDSANKYLFSAELCCTCFTTLVAERN